MQAASAAAYAILIRVLGRAGCTLEAKALLLEMRRLGLHLDATHYNASTRHCFSWSSSAGAAARPARRRKERRWHRLPGLRQRHRGAGRVGREGMGEEEDDVGPTGQKGGKQRQG